MSGIPGPTEVTWRIWAVGGVEFLPECDADAADQASQFASAGFTGPLAANGIELLGKYSPLFTWPMFQ